MWRGGVKDVEGRGEGCGGRGEGCGGEGLRMWRGGVKDVEGRGGCGRDAVQYKAHTHGTQVYAPTHVPPPSPTHLHTSTIPYTHLHHSV